MSKRLASVPYILFATGCSLVVYAGFVWICDRGGWQSQLMRTFGQNALLAYALHHLVLRAMKPLVPYNSPVWYVLAALLVFVAVNLAVLQYLERQQVVIRL